MFYFHIRRYATPLLAAVFVPVIAVFLQSAGNRNSMDQDGGKSLSRLATRTFPRTPLLFEANRGQAEGQSDFICRLGDLGVFFRPGEIILVPHGQARQAPKAGASALLRMKFDGSDLAARPEGLELHAAKSHYFIGNDPRRWITHVPQYSRIRYPNVYPGIDLLVYGDAQNLEYDFVVKPGADPDRIRWRFEGAERLAVGPAGDLQITVAGQEIIQRAPAVYQQISGRKVEVSGGFRVRGVDQVGFRIGSYDRTRPLIVDPVIVYSTYLGGNGREDRAGIAVDGLKNLYVSGTTNSISLLSTSPDSVLLATDVFVAKLNPSGSSLIYITYLGGAGAEVASGVAVDSQGNAYLAGRTNSPGFPVTAGAFQTSFGGNADAFVAKLNPSGSALAYSTFLGGGTAIGYDAAEDIAVDSLGEACVVGSTESDNFPTRGAFQPGRNFSRDAFVAKLNPTGSGLIFSTYLGGGPSPGETGFAVAVDSAGSVYVTGQTAAVDFPVTPGALQSKFQGICFKEGVAVPCADAFVAKFSPLGILIYSTYLGGAGEEKATGIAVDGQGNAYVAGSTDSVNFPLVFPIQAVNAGTRDLFISKMNPTGSALIYSSYLGGGDVEEDIRVALDSSANVYLTGSTRSQGYPLLDPVRSVFGGVREIFLTKVDRTGASLGYSTFLGGSDNERSPRLAVDFVPNVYVSGATTSGDIPLVNPIQRGNHGGTGDLMIFKISETEKPACSVSCSATVVTTVRAGSPVSFTAASSSSTCAGSAVYEWDFGDSSALALGQSTSHAYAAPGSYNWTLTVRVGEVSCTRNGTIQILAPARRRP